MNSENSNSVGRYIGAICVSFFFSILSSFILFPLAIRCDNIGAFWGICIFAGMVVIVGFVGVFAGTLIFQKPDRRKASKHLLLFGLGFCVLLLPIFRFGILPLILPIALGGFSAVLIFKKLDGQISESNYNRFFGASASVAFGLIILFIATIVWIGRAQEITANKAAKNFQKAGGIEKVEQESKILFKQVGTNDYWFHPSDKTNFPALSSLGNVSVNHNQINIRFGGHFHTKFITIFPNTPTIDQMSVGNNQAFYKEYYTSRCIQVATNIFISK
ncbi:MAG TPA: hypothetical protein VHG71_01915 [Verrucomicrobiae bacterium]|nr:hypothetical protein [Verrucomicrobiae bacterium]